MAARRNRKKKAKLAAAKAKAKAEAKAGQEAAPEKPAEPEPRAEEATVVLYRCPTPTNFLCPCGAAARKLKRTGVSYRTERVPYSRKNRPEIEELTKQRRVPLLVDGDEIVHDSRRISQYLDWKRSRPGKSARSG